MYNLSRMTNQPGANMSRTGLSGMTWPSAAQHAPDASVSVLPRPSSAYLSPAIWGNRKFSILHIAETKVSSGTTSVLHPTMSPSLNYDLPNTNSPPPAVTTIKKNCIHNATVPFGVPGTSRSQLSGLPTTTKPANAVYVAPPISRTRTVKRHTTTKTFKENQIRRATPTVARPVFTPPPQPQSPGSSPPNHGAIIGGIIGAILAFLFLLLLIKLCRPRRKKFRDVENGHPRHRHHDTRAVLDEVQRLNQKRHRGDHRRASTAAIDLANARNWEHGFDPGRFHPAPCARPDSISSFGMSPVELAQACAWNEATSINGLYGCSQHHVPAAYPQHPPAMPTRKPVTQAGRMPSVRRTGRGGGSVRSVSPLSGDERVYAGGYGQGNYRDVSPIGSPIGDRSF